MLAFVVYVVLNEYHKTEAYSNVTVTIALSGLIYFSARQFIVNNKIQKEVSSYSLLVFQLIGLIELTVVLGQFYRLVFLREANAILLGTFNNSGILAIYMGVVSTLSLSNYLFSAENTKIDKINKNLSAICILLTILLLPSIQSRTSFLSLLSVSVVIISYRYRRLISKWTAKFKYLTSSAIFIVLCISFVFLYYFKEDSANGRVVIWKTTALIIKKNPISGIGHNQFHNKFPDYQSAYFKNNAEDGQRFADKDDYAFNEFLQIFAEDGAIGLVLFAGLLVFVFKSIHFASAPDYILSSAFCLMYVLLASLTSYPLQNPSIWFAFVFFILVISGSSFESVGVVQGWKSKSFIGLCCLLCLYCLYYQLNINRSKKEINSAKQSFADEDYKTALDGYNNALHFSPNEKDITLEIGKTYLLLEDNKNAIRTLSLATKYISDPFLYINLGESYANLKDYASAERCFIKAIDMFPNRIYPKYLLAKMYIQSKQHVKAVMLARDVVNMPVRIESSATLEMKTELKTYLNQ